MEYVSVSLSVLAAVSSLYVWLVTANGERPRLRTHLVDDPQDRVNGNADLYYCPTSLSVHRMLLANLIKEEWSA